MSPLSPVPSSKQPQSKRAMLGSVFNQITEITNINNLRQFQATYDPRQAPETLKLQLLIKAQKSLVVDSEGLARDSHMVSKQLYLWACEQPDQALKDVGDRLAYMNYQIGDLQQQCSKTLEKSRNDLKEIRNLENELIKIRDREKTLQIQINKLLQDPRQRPETSEKISSLTAEHAAVVEKMKETEAMIPAHKRLLIKSSYRTQFEALREMGDKLMIISQFGDLLLDELPEDPHLQYSGEDRTAQIKGAASQALSDYNGPVFSRPNTDLGNLHSSQLTGGGSSSLHRTDTRLFSETHPHVLADVSNDSHAGANIGSSSSHSPRPSGSTTTGILPVNHQPAFVPSSQPPKLPNRPCSNFAESSSHPGGSSAEKMHTFFASPELEHGQPTVAEVGAHVPTTTNGPAQGILHPPHSQQQQLHHQDQSQQQSQDSDQLPAYSPVPPEKL
ncbi:uncharacterized protein PGTG_14368 [Puccinia graminis f. sp. tritici CRL 75-36-700-3]|uniref:Eisosome component PIL1-domain-containing protein n=1 Tax=Puccinia graminis f. sp. tritici (strain CRL 75-36-700-3 / race SCCL) TaxID=418459 RepID=E3KV61_PUCGT|nr:uncharacterized protein PGTG_14368 [Puccinia graminis f. sp. tritici CRL 75-36-700-3]EFP88284.2 hypothetical protein PGTG_14368 [Puccinia graminis f. sp. tritici CRL 75-36-700-3]